MTVSSLRMLHPERIVVRGTNWIGDAVMTTPALSALRAAYPDAEIVMLANPLVAELFRVHPAVDRVMVYDRKGCHKGLGGFWAMAAELRREKFDLAVLLQNAVEAALLAFVARIPCRAGYTTDGRRLLLNAPVTVTAADKRLHHTDYYLQLLRRLGIEGGDGRLCLAINQEEQSWAESILGDDPVIAVNPGAAYGSAKRWIPARFAEVADTLAERYQSRILLTGGPGETEIGRDIAAVMTHDVINMVGRTTVRQMMALLANSRLLVTNDSGPMHVASAFDIPIVAVFGSTDHTTTCPASERVRIVRKDTDCAPCLLRQCPTDHRCMTAIEASDVIEAACALLDKP